MPEFISHSEIETRQIAINFATTLTGGDVVTLTGELGAGKTAFTKGIAAAFGIEKEITSPTFAIMNVYQINQKSIERLVHIDTYRLKSAEELLAIGADEYIGAANAVTIIEWPEIAESLLVGKNIKHVLLEHLESGGRKITIR